MILIFAVVVFAFLPAFALVEFLQCFQLTFLLVALLLFLSDLVWRLNRFLVSRVVELRPAQMSVRAGTIRFRRGIRLRDEAANCREAGEDVADGLPDTRDEFGFLCKQFRLSACLPVHRSRRYLNLFLRLLAICFRASQTESLDEVQVLLG